MSTKKLSAKAQAALDIVIQKFQNNNLSDFVNVIAFQLDPNAPAASWSFGNQVLAFSQSGNLDNRGFRQWQKVKRQVKKGSSAIFIFSPLTFKVEDENGKEKHICTGFKATPVFSIESTEGEPIPSYTPATLPPLSDVAARMGIDVNYCPLPPDRLGDYTPSRERIRLGTKEESVWFHELAHTAHKKIDGKLKGGQDASQETIAELAAAVLMQLYGLRDHTGNAWQYIEHYNANPLTAIMKATSKVGEILALLLNTPDNQLINTKKTQKDIIKGV